MAIEDINRDEVCRFCKGGCQGISDCYSDCLRLLLAEKYPNLAQTDIASTLTGISDVSENRHLMIDFLDLNYDKFCGCKNIDVCDWCASDKICAHEYSENPIIIHAQYPNNNTN